MRPRFSSTTFVLLIGIGIGIGVLPALARDRVEMVSAWHVTPEATRAHPKKLQIAIVVTESTDIVACDVRESWDRRSWDEETEPPSPLAGGGKVIATLKIVKESGTLQVGKQTEAMELYYPWGSVAPVGWTDESAFVCEGCPDNLQYERTAKLPMRVEPGDVILFALKFKGMPRLEAEPSAQPPYSDEIHFYAKCQSCGSVGYPCADPW